VTAKPLTPKQAAFVREYLVDLNAAAAAERAGYAAKSARYSARDISAPRPGHAFAARVPVPGSPLAKTPTTTRPSR
jgi:hypothetical protein